MSAFQIYNVETEVSLSQGAGEHSPVDEYDVEVSFQTEDDTNIYHGVLVCVDICDSTVIKSNVENNSLELFIGNPKGMEPQRIEKFQWARLVVPRLAAAAANAVLKYILDEDDVWPGDEHDEDPVWADADALASAGFGTDEDYGSF